MALGTTSLYDFHDKDMKYDFIDTGSRVPNYTYVKVGDFLTRS